MRLAVTGHRGLTEATQRLVDAGLRHIIAEYAEGDLVGLSRIADGADSIFAQAILDAGATLVVIVPAAKYRAGLPKPIIPFMTSCSTERPTLSVWTTWSPPPNHIWPQVSACSKTPICFSPSGTGCRRAAMAVPRMLCKQHESETYPSR